MGLWVAAVFVRLPGGEPRLSGSVPLLAGVELPEEVDVQPAGEMNGWAGFEVQPVDESVFSVAHDLAIARSTSVIALTVEDSDRSVLALFDESGSVDRVVFDAFPPEEQAPPTLATASWTPLLQSGADVSRLHAATRLEDVVFAEEFLYELLPMVGIDLEALLDQRPTIDERRGSEASTWQPSQVYLFANPDAEVGRRYRVKVTWPGATLRVTGEPISTGALRMVSASVKGEPTAVVVTATGLAITAPHADGAPTTAPNDSTSPGVSRAFAELTFEPAAEARGRVIFTAAGHQAALDLTIHPQAPAPLRGAYLGPSSLASVNMPASLRHLHAGPYLVFWATFGPPIDDVTRAAWPIIEQWLDRFDRREGSRLMVEWDNGDDSHSADIRVDRRHSSPRWRHVSRLEGMNVDADVVEDPDARTPEVEPGPGMRWTALPPNEHGSRYLPTEGASQLLLWVERPSTSSAMESLLSELIGLGDELCATTPLVQCFVDCVSGVPWEVATEYESICGIWGIVTVTPHWSKRWLRACAPLMWLGPELQRHLDTDALTAVAQTQPVRDHLRLRVQHGRPINDLERVIAPILPSHDDWKQAITELAPAGLPPWIDEVERYA